MTELTTAQIRRRRVRGTLAVACAFLMVAAPGCAAMTGLLTGAFTGAIDAPAQVYRKNRAEMDHHPEYWTFNALIVGPIGFAAGPIVGFAKGLSTDLQWLINRLRYDRVFTTYKNPSVWRPYTIHW